MRLVTLLRVSAAPKVAIVLIPWIVMYSGNLSDWIVDGYWESVTAQSGFMIGFIAPACAVCAAWEGARLRSSGLLRAAQVRSPLTVAAAHLLPTLLLGIASVFLSLLLVAPAAWGQIGGRRSTSSGYNYWSSPLTSRSDMYWA